jgi:hypothetical protein
MGWGLAWSDDPMKPSAIKAGMFLRCAKNGFVREILYVGGPGAVFAGITVAGEVFYADEFGVVGRCGRAAMVRWAEKEIPRPAGWVRPHSSLLEQLYVEGKLPEQHGIAPDLPFSKERSDLAKSIVLHAFRNTLLEDIHAGRGVRSETGTFDDVKVVTPYGDIPWNEVSHISDEQMRTLMIGAVNTVYTMLAFSHLKFRVPNGWNEAVLDEDMLTMIALSGCLGETAQAEAEAKIDASVRARFGGSA